MKKQLIISLFLTLACIMLLIVIRNQSLAMAAPPFTPDPDRDYIVASTLTNTEQLNNIKPHTDNQNQSPLPANQAETPAISAASATPTTSAASAAPAVSLEPDAAPVVTPGNLPSAAIPVDAQPSLPIIPEGAPAIAFTFDDGPSSTHTPLLLAGLKERNVHASFFVLGNRAEQNPEIILQIAQDGHTLANHGYDHQDAFTNLDIYQLNAQVVGTNDILQQIIGQSPSPMVRPPYGAINEQTADDTNMAVMMWNIDPRDWECRDSEQIYNHIIDHAVDGGVIVLHDIFPETIEASLRAIDTLKEQGWAILSLEQLYAYHGKPLLPGTIYRGPLE